MALGDPGRQQRIDAACTYAIAMSGIDEVKKALNPENMMGMGCRVIKHPDCCVLCAANNDCGALPIHARCRCKPEGYLETLE